MRIAVDARPFEERPTGAGRVLGGLLPAWRRSFPADTFVLLSPRPVFLPPPLAGDAALAVRTGPPLPGTIWLQTVAGRAARRAGADLFLGTLSIVPALSSLPSVALVHDLTPLLHPEWHPWKNRLGFSPFFGATVRRAARIATVSAATREDLLRLYPDAAERTAVVPNGLTPAPGPPGGAAPNGGRPYVLFLGTLEPRKNLPRLVAAMEAIWDRTPDFPDLLLAGGAGWGLPGFAEGLGRSRHAARIRPLGWQPDGECARLLRGARLLAYPSLYEGFGLPPLEAMALGIPVVGSASSSLPEVIGDAGLLPDPESVEGIAAALRRAHEDAAWREAARARGLERAKAFTWEASAARLRSLCEEAIR
ncbi:MAG TPA: glycosyltransferase family 1 protein [Thermoanaerobaculia bacterium]|nr:glycosyltransferase family 1 protein [Thermoanaerobaculia bacterium]HQR66620.1 glycosyltransferase family 1 protein [Thermoanaerobaculia bacterium]